LNQLKISKKILEAVLIRSLFFIFLFSTGLLEAQQSVPTWFKTLPQSGRVNISVGYTGKYRDKQLARQAALNQARKNLAKQKQVRLIFEIQEMSDGYYRLMQPTFEEIYFEKVKFQVDSHSVILDSAFIDDRYFILLTDDESYRDFHSLQVNWGAKPRWTETMPESKKYVYGVGMVANYSYWKNGWQDADSYARFDACKNMQLKSASPQRDPSCDPERLKGHNLTAVYLSASNFVALTGLFQANNH